MPDDKQFDPAKVKLGVVPTIWSNDDKPSLGDSIPFEQCVSEIALAKFEGTALGHKFPKDSITLRRALDLRGLTVCSAWVGTYFTAHEMRQQTLDAFACQLKILKPFGSADLVVAELGQAVHQQPVAVLPNKPRFDDGQWRALVEGLNELGRQATYQGMRLAYHPHVGTGVQDLDEIDRLMNETDPAAVTLLLDTAHLAYAGVDPLQVAKAYAGRIRHVHLKDLRRKVRDESVKIGRSFLDSILAGVFTVPGDPDGEIDFDAILRTLASPFEGWLVVEAEQDPARAHPLTYAKMARSYLSRYFQGA